MEEGDSLQLFYYLTDPLEAPVHVCNLPAVKEAAGKRGRDTFGTIAGGVKCVDLVHKKLTIGFINVSETRTLHGFKQSPACLIIFSVSDVF